MENAAQNLDGLIIYRQLLDDALMQRLIAAAAKNTTESQAEISYQLIIKAETLGLSGNIAQNYVIHLIAQDENIFSQQAEKNSGAVGDSLLKASAQDIGLLRAFWASLAHLFQSDLITALRRPPHVTFRGFLNSRPRLLTAKAAVI